MAVKPDGKTWSVKEQTVEDGISGLTFTFEILPDNKPRLHVVSGMFPDVNLQLLFNEKGEFHRFAVGSDRPEEGT